MATWKDGAEYAPIERPFGFASADTEALPTSQPYQAATPGAVAAPATLTLREPAAPLSALVAEREHTRNPQQPFEISNAFGGALEQRDPTQPFNVASFTPSDAMPAPTGLPVALGPDGRPMNANPAGGNPVDPNPGGAISDLYGGPSPYGPPPSADLVYDGRGSWAPFEAPAAPTPSQPDPASETILHLLMLLFLLAAIIPGSRVIIFLVGALLLQRTRRKAWTPASLIFALITFVQGPQDGLSVQALTCLLMVVVCLVPPSEKPA